MTGEITILGGESGIPAETDAAATTDQTAVGSSAADQASAGAVSDQASAAESAPAALPGAPDKYVWTAPEGKTLDPQTLDAFAVVAKDLNLPQDQAQRVVDAMVPTMAARQAEQLTATSAQWAAQSKADKEFGGDAFDANMATAKQALKDFGTPELNALLNESGLGNHPDVIRFMVRAGKALSADKHVGGRAAPGAGSDVKSLYPNSKMN